MGMEEERSKNSSPSQRNNIKLDRLRVGTKKRGAARILFEREEGDPAKEQVERMRPTDMTGEKIAETKKTVPKWERTETSETSACAGYQAERGGGYIPVQGNRMSGA